MYRNMGGLPIDDRKASLMMGNVDIRFYRRLKQQLISLGLLVERDNCIANKRVEDEISEYVREYKRRRDAALIREAKKRNPAQKALLLPEVREKLGRSSDYFSMKFSSANHDASQQVSEKPNEINGCGATALAEPYQNCVLRADASGRARGRGLELELEEDKKIPLSEPSVSDQGKAKRARKDYPEQFEQFWSGYPDTRNNSKTQAYGEWVKLTETEKSMVLASLALFGAYCKENPDYRCVHAERYIKQRRFEGHQPKSATSNASAWWTNPQKAASIPIERWRQAIAQHANGVWPIDKLGPPPGTSSCVVPKQLLAELDLVRLYDANGIRRTESQH